MGERHPLASPGAWVQLRDPSELLAGDQRTIEDGITGPGNMTIQRQITDGLIKVLVVNWELPVPLPLPSQSPESLDRMTILDYQRLKRLVEPAMKVVFPDDPEPEDPAALEAAKADPGSPTGDADAS